MQPNLVPVQRSTRINSKSNDTNTHELGVPDNTDVDMFRRAGRARVKNLIAASDRAARASSTPTPAGYSNVDPTTDNHNTVPTAGSPQLRSVRVC